MDCSTEPANHVEAIRHRHFLLSILLVLPLHRCDLELQLFEWRKLRLIPEGERRQLIRDTIGGLSVMEAVIKK